jgi:histidine triad (HIT) family protein
LNECIFCEIVSGHLASEIVAEGDQWIGFRDANPTAPSHVLVVPRRHVRSLDELTESDADLAIGLLLGCREVAAREGLGPGYRVVANVGEEGGQAVDHLHFHVLGGRRLGWPPG